MSEVITLPPKVKCPECGGKGHFRIGGIYSDPNPCPRCNGEGEVYLDRDLIEAIVAADFLFKLESLIIQNLLAYQVIIYRRDIHGNEFLKSVAYEITPTAALLAAITAHNAKEEK